MTVREAIPEKVITSIQEAKQFRVTGWPYQEQGAELLMRSESYIAGKKELSIGTHTGDA